MRLEKNRDLRMLYSRNRSVPLRKYVQTLGVLLETAHEMSIVFWGLYGNNPCSSSPHLIPEPATKHNGDHFPCTPRLGVRSGEGLGFRFRV